MRFVLRGCELWCASLWSDLCSVMILRASNVAILFKLSPLGFSVLSWRIRRKRSEVLRGLLPRFLRFASWVVMLPLIYFYWFVFVQKNSQHPKVTFFGKRISCVTGFVCASCQHWLSPRQKLLQIVMLCLISRSVVDLEALCAIATVISDLFLPLPTMTCRPPTRLRAQSLLIWQVSALGLSHISILRDTREGYIDNPEINCL